MICICWQCGSGIHWFRHVHDDRPILGCDLNACGIVSSATGAIHAQLLDSLFPGTVPLHKLKWQAKLEPEYIHNFKIVQEAFDKKQIAKNIPVDRLIKGKNQDNLEFLQWMHTFWQQRHAGVSYDARGERIKAAKGKDFVPPSATSGAGALSTGAGHHGPVLRARPTAKAAGAAAGRSAISSKHESGMTSKTSDNDMTFTGFGNTTLAAADSLDRSIALDTSVSSIDRSVRCQLSNGRCFPLQSILDRSLLLESECLIVFFFFSSDVFRLTCREYACGYI